VSIRCQTIPKCASQKSNLCHFHKYYHRARNHRYVRRCMCRGILHTPCLECTSANDIRRIPIHWLTPVTYSTKNQRRRVQDYTLTATLHQREYVAAWPLAHSFVRYMPDTFVFAWHTMQNARSSVVYVLPAHVYNLSDQHAMPTPQNTHLLFVSFASS
jgi:hypothetical protein